MNLINFQNVWVLMSLCYFAVTSTKFPDHHPRNESRIIKQNNNQTSLKRKFFNNRSENRTNVKTLSNATDLLSAAADYQPRQLHTPVAIKPRGFNLPKNRPAEQRTKEATELAEQNYYSNYFADTPAINQAQPLYSLGEEPIILKFLSHQAKQFQPRQTPTFSAQDAVILGSGDFGILRGGTFYSDEQQAYNNEEGSDFYYGEASNTHAVSSTEGFVQKYTYPEEQFAQFRDFADLGTPVDSDFSQFVVVYANKNATTGHQNSKPKNIFEQLQEIDREKALEQKKMRKNQTNNSKITKLKLVKTKLMEKKWVQKQPAKVLDDDPLIALS